jgi:hypothetical protein
VNKEKKFSIGLPWASDLSRIHPNARKLIVLQKSGTFVHHRATAPSSVKTKENQKLLTIQ